MDNKISEIFIPGPAGRLETKYYKSKKNTSPIAHHHYTLSAKLAKMADLFGLAYWERSLM